MAENGARQGRDGIGRRQLLGYSAATAAVTATGVVGSGAAPAAASTTGDRGEAAVPPDVMAKIRRGDRARLRELGIIIGVLPTGKWNAITDVPGVKVGYRTLIFDHPGIARTGVTIVVPRDDIESNWCYAGWHCLNGNGEMTGTHWIHEGGTLTSLIGLTHTTQVGIVRDTLVKMEVEKSAELAFLLPVVAETYDGGMDQVGKYWITEDDVREAVANAKSGPIAEGNVGGGTGMHYFGFKGGTGTSSRVVKYHGNEYTVGVLIQTNYEAGGRSYLRVNGAPVGLEIPESEVPGFGPPALPSHSCIVVIATDAPMLAHQCRRLAQRAGLGQADTGAYASNGSGDLYIAFATGNDVPQVGQNSYDHATAVNDNDIDPFFQAVVEATQEAAHNSMTMAKTMTGWKGTLHAIPLERLVQVVRKHKLYGPGFPI